MARREIPRKQIKRLYAVSGNRCAFRGCDQLLCEPGDAEEDGVVTGEIAHIVAASRQGPRGRAELDDEARDRAENLILLCERHHKIVDARPRTYTVDVLQEMKRRHEAPFLTTATPEPVGQDLVSETLLSSLLAVSELPRLVYAAPHLASNGRDVAASVHWDAARGKLVSYIVREHCVLSFHDLRAADGPFAEAVDRGAVDVFEASELCAKPDGKLWYVELLNRGLSSHLRRLGLRYDPEHARHFFTLQKDGTSPKVRYKTKTGRWMSREVVTEATARHSGQSRGFWWHDAAAFRFIRPAPDVWALSIRPEFHLTSDGTEPLQGDRVGRRVTRRKSTIYNAQYIDRIQFWRELITESKPRLILRLGTQRAVIDNELLTCEVTWPGVPGDTMPVNTDPVQDDLLSYAELYDFDDLDDVADGDLDDEI